MTRREMARFNLNVLAFVNRELGADFDLGAFAHVAVWDSDQDWIEMRLRSARAQTVHVKALNLDIDFAPEETMRTEISAKFTRARLERDGEAWVWTGGRKVGDSSPCL